MNRNRFILMGVFLLVLITGALDPLGWLGPDKLEQKLIVLRAELLEYTYKNKTPPPSLKDYALKNAKSILHDQGEIKESSQLDFSGGWYYQPEKMEVGLNEKKYKQMLLSFRPPNPAFDGTSSTSSLNRNSDAGNK